ncbi:Prokaryotic ubiquitin-like protein Pup [Actinosynnema pretiosum subsp. pretiosum]|nr:Prokaryotic ubiquitin-like protein Pup [Actinosynnema pretiosum subsp. pretiosum]
MGPQRGITVQPDGGLALLRNADVKRQSRSVVLTGQDPRTGEVGMAQEQVQRQGGGDGDDGGDAAAAAGQERREKLGEDVDAILDEIDDVLEENAEDFVRAYVQKGGE